MRFEIRDFPVPPWSDEDQWWEVTDDGERLMVTSSREAARDACVLLNRVNAITVDDFNEEVIHVLGQLVWQKRKEYADAN